MSGSGTLPQTSTVEVPFAATGGTAPLTWGQREIWRSLRWLGDNDHYFNSAMAFPVPAGCDEARVYEAVRRLVERHEGLRTRFPGYADGPHQEVPATGTFPVQVVDAPAGQGRAVGQATVAAMQQRSFDHERDWPVRIALIRSDGQPRVVLFVASHLVMDGAGGWVVWTDLNALLAGEPLPDRQAWGPLRLAGYESGPDGVRRHETSARRWRADLRTMPASIFDFPTGTPARPRFHDYTLSSPALAVACTRVADSLRATNSTVLLAACAALVAHYTGHADLAMHLIVANRYRPELRDTVAAMTENGLFTADLSGPTFADAVAACWRGALTTFRTAHYDPFAMEEVIVSVERERGAFCEREAAFFNDMRPTDRWDELPGAAPGADGLAALRDGTTLECTDRQERLALKLFFEVLPTPDLATVLLQVDTAYVEPDVARRLLAGVETLVVRAADHPVGLAELTDLTGVEPVRRGPDWVRYGPGWYRPAAVEQLLTGLDEVAAATVHVEDGRPVAYLCPTDAGLTVAALHERVCAALRDRTDAIAPASYTLCARAPGPDGDWTVQPVRCKGTGRDSTEATA